MTAVDQTRSDASRFSAGTNRDAVSIDALIAAAYDSISGPAGMPRDWRRQRALFLTRALLVAGAPNAEGRVSVEVLDPDDYAETRAPYFERHGFYEREIARQTSRYGCVAHVLSAYESRHEPGGPVVMRGVNSFQLLHVNDRWWIASVAWQHESPDNPIPPDLLAR